MERYIELLPTENDFRAFLASQNISGGTSTAPSGS